MSEAQVKRVSFSVSRGAAPSSFPADEFFDPFVFLLYLSCFLSVRDAGGGWMVGGRRGLHFLARRLMLLGFR